eukprot:TRINITY_DN107367_c0_g1_i1.p1 TRINITY_DN107367_c0_g1~~TRINITY_DN107367_c0_g1_i1.p1  ORF type:complete len:245 (-),score=22.49 TRINITY_DN107367_c0_g1_i1:190-864(-)
MDAWDDVWTAAEMDPSIEISVDDNFTRSQVGGEYKLNRTRWSDMSAPSFCCGNFGRSTRCLYFDSESRWRVGLGLHMKSQRAGGAGYLRSSPTKPGLPPTEHGLQWEVYDDGKWAPCSSFCIRLWWAAYDIIPGVAIPDLVVSLKVILPKESDGRIFIKCNRLSGVEVTSLHLDPDTHFVADLRSMLANSIFYPRDKLKVVTLGGRLLSASDDISLIASVLGIE